MPYNYSTFVQALKIELNRVESNTNFTNIIPTLIDQAEQKCYMALDLLSTIVTNNAGATVPNQRQLTLSQTSGYFINVQEVNIVNGSSRTPCIKTSRIALNMLWPDENAPDPSSIPDKWAPITDQIIQFGPSPGSALTVEVIGTVRPTPLSEANPNTFLTDHLSALFLAATMVAGTAYNRDWGANKDDPKMALSWDDEYTKQLSLAQGEETKRKYQAFASA